MLSVAGLACVRGEQRLFNDLAFTVEPGSLLHVHGPNGSGKTTLLRALCGLVEPEAGCVCWQGQSIRELGDDYLRQLNYVGHLNGLKDDLTPLENLHASAALAGAPVAEEQVLAVLARMGLKGREDLATKVLSAGQKRRCALARLLLRPAGLWVLDEPFNALDVHGVEVVQWVLSEHLEHGGLVVLTTHQEVAAADSQLQHLHLDT